MNVFHGATSRVFSYCLILPVGFNFNLTYRLRPQVSGIKPVTVYRQSIFQVEWLIATLIFSGV